MILTGHEEPKSIEYIKYNRTLGIGIIGAKEDKDD